MTVFKNPQERLQWQARCEDLGVRFVHEWERLGFAWDEGRAMMRPLREKGAAGFGSLFEVCGKSRRNRPGQRLSLFVPPVFGGSMGGPRGPAGLRKLHRSSNPSSRRPRLEAGATVFANLKLGGRHG